MTGPDRPSGGSFSSRDALLLGAGVVLALLAVFVWTMWTRDAGSEAQTAEETSAVAARTSADDVTVPREVLEGAGVEAVQVTSQPLVERVETTGVVEPNQLQIQQVTPLIAGRVEQVAVTLGDRVQAGTVLLMVSSPQIAEFQGTLRSHEATLAEAEATFNRTKQLVELGAGAGKDLVAAEAQLRTAEAQVTQLRQTLGALGAASDGNAATGVVAIRAPMSGTVIERTINPGAWIEAGTSVVTIANLSTVWVIANLPETRLNVIRLGAPVEIRAPTLGGSALTGHVNYIDPRLDQETRTANVRVEVSNAGQSLKVGMFVDVTVWGAARVSGTEFTVPADAVQRIGARTIVFVPTTDPERFEVRDVELGDEIQNAYVIRSGLAPGDRVVAKGGFMLKSQLLKGQFGEDEEIAGQ